MKLARYAALERLAQETRCLGALFTSYTFDPSFFEHHVLATILQVAADPDEEAAVYHDEALAALQEVPVACFVDGAMRPVGHELPYDLREVKGRCFHPKVVLLVFESFARLSVGSGNLTKAGHGGNAEMFFVRDLEYAEPEHAGVLRQVIAFFEAIDTVATPGGRQTQQVLEALARRIANTSAPDGESAMAFLHTEADRGLLERFLELLPDEAKITSIGVLAPFFERDDVEAAAPEEVSSVLKSLAVRAGKRATLDVGVGWEDASIAPGASTRRAIAEGMNELWAFQAGTPEEPEPVEYFTPIAETASNYRVLDERGQARLLPKDETDEQIQSGHVWHVGVPHVFAPAGLLAAAREIVSDVRLHVFPSPQLIAGHPVERPLHAKLLAVTYRTRSRERTLLLVGSANASRMAMLATPAGGGNVEACMAFVIDDAVTLKDLSPELVYCPGKVELRERAFPELPAAPPVPFIEAAVFDARAETLTITWAPNPDVEVGDWILRYQDHELERGTGVPRQATVLSAFKLSPASCEVVVAAAEGEKAFPILVDDLAALPLTGGVRSLGLRELLALITRRLTPARHKFILERHGTAMVDATLTALLGEGFAPTDVFRAWWTVREDLQVEGLTLAAFRLRLWGTLGAATVWRRLREVCGALESGVRPEEAWLYGSELRRELVRCEPADGADREAKIAELTHFLAELEHDLEALQPFAAGRTWVSKIVDFYRAGHQ